MDQWTVECNIYPEFRVEAPTDGGDRGMVEERHTTLAELLITTYTHVAVEWGQFYIPPNHHDDGRRRLWATAPQSATPTRQRRDRVDERMLEANTTFHI